MSKDAGSAYGLVVDNFIGGLRDKKIKVNTVDFEIKTKLTETVNKYETFCGNEDDRQKAAMEAVRAINEAYIFDVIEPGHGVWVENGLLREKVSKLEQDLSLAKLDRDQAMELQQTTADENIGWQSKLEQLREDYQKLLDTLQEESQTDARPRGGTKNG